MPSFNRSKDGFKVRMLKFWEEFLCKKRSRFKRLLIASILATLGFLVIAFLHYETGGVYFSSVTIFTTILLALYSGLLQSLVLTVILSLLADYFFIPPAGSVFDSPVATEHFLVIVSLGMIMSTLISTLRSAFYRAVLAKQEAEKAVQSRDLLIAVISHELKNPLTAIGSSIQLVKKTTPALEQMPMLKKMIENINTSIHRMSRLVSDLLDVTIFDTGRVNLESTTVEVKSLVRDVIEAFSPAAEEKSLKLDYQISPSCPPEIVCDRDRIIQALSNMVGNAVKFTNRGSVTVQVKKVANEIQFQVRDTGPGIPKDYLSKVFDRYWQDRETAYRGTGLGLSISKGIVEAHGGKLWVESQVGEGSVFVFALPVVPTKAAQKKLRKTG